MSNYNIAPLNDEILDVGTRIHWDDVTQSLYYVDVPNSTFHKHNLRSGQNTKVKIGNEPLAFMFPVEGSNTKFIGGMGRKFIFVEWDGMSPKVSKIDVIDEVDQEDVFTQNRLNGAKVDPWGRLWAGTMGPADEKGEIIKNRGSLYNLDKGKVVKKLSNIGISNGLAWNIKTQKMYYVDTLEPVVFEYSISDSGCLSDQKIVFDFKKHNIEGLPDGLEIDAEGKLWVTAIHGSELVRFDPQSGEVLTRIAFPTKQVTSICFGGDDFGKMFVTTARIPVDNKIPPAPAGTTYVVNNPGCHGLKGYRYKS